jgi:hypothetical protein
MEMNHPIEANSMFMLKWRCCDERPTEVSKRKGLNKCNGCPPIVIKYPHSRLDPHVKVFRFLRVIRDAVQPQIFGAEVTVVLGTTL